VRATHAAALACLLVASALGAADGPIRVPSGPAVPVPMPPAPSPGGVVALSGDALFVVDSDAPVIVLASPKGLVTVTEEAGPIRIRGRFADGLGKVESRVYKGKQVVTVEAAGTGRCEILVVPVGATKETDVIRRLLDVDSGTGPIPPPTPPKPEPKPEPDPTPKASKVTVVICEVTAERTVAQAKAINDPEFRAFVAGTGGSVEVVSSKDPVFAANGYKRFADKAGMPAVLVFDADAAGPSDPLVTFKLSDAPADNLARVRKVVK
jgi:hypothetical protein